ncbi:jerky protein homolog-like [Wyeomyia smithii]|uniref:jerky protein homolog-like n=1 Tax=Wyeomyia smithii TaxID=174621 RepID=UPI002467F171|nr:jerky protein homolog-like [Wyeomyia smithii]
MVKVAVEKSKRKSLTLMQKMEIIKKLENNTGTKIAIAKDYGVNRATIRKIELQKGKLVQASSSRGFKSSKVKYATLGKYHLLEHALFYWFIQMRDKHQIITNNLIRAKARVFAKEFNIPADFKFSETWMRNFKTRFGIRRLKVSGEKLSSDAASVEPFKLNFLSYLQERNLTAQQVYNGDESSLFYKALLGYTLVHAKETTAPGLKMAKDRITFMPCANATGTHKLRMLVIGKSKNPRAFKNVQIPVDYASSKNAWMTREIFQKWFHESFVPNVRDFSNRAGIETMAVLLLDNCTAHHFQHELISDDGLIEVKFLPPNVTPLLQPMDQQVIQIIKTNYRDKLHLEIANEPDFEQRIKKINLKDVSFWLHEAWMDVSETVIQRSWKNIGWIVGTNLLHEDSVPLHAEIFALVFNKDDKSSGDTDEEGNDVNAVAEHDEEDLILKSIVPPDPSLTRTQQVAQELARVIEWAEDKHLEIADILHLRKIRSVALQLCLNE